MLTLALSSSAVAVCVACALAYSASDYFRKAVPLRASAPLALFYAFLLEIPVLGLWVLVSGDTRIESGYVLPGLVVAVLGMAANILFMVALRRSPLSLMIPLLAMVPVLTALSGGALLGEWPTVQQALGIVFVAAGLFALYVPDEGAHPLRVWRNLMSEPGTRPMGGVVLLWSISPAVDKMCLAHAGVGMHGLVQLVILAAALGLWLALRGGPRALSLPSGTLKPLAGVALAAGLGYGLQLAAYQMTLVAVVELFKRVIGLLGALLLGRAFFREPLSVPKIVGIAIMTVGLPLVLLG
jgi:drug/metabolite transporter (DMT)-like permease